MFTHPGIDPIAFTIGNLSVHWYGLMYLLGFLCFSHMGRYQLKLQVTLSIENQQQNSWKLSEFEDFLLWLMPFIVIGGRIGYVLFYQLDYYLANPLDIFKIWNGGMSFHGGFLGVICLMLLHARKQKKSFWTIADFCAPLAPIGIATGRIGNFINGELWGRTTDVPWAMIFPHVDNLPRHPSQLYEFLGEGVLLFFALRWISSKNFPRGLVAGAFPLGYGIARFIIEFFRQPDVGSSVKLGLTTGQWLSFPMILVGIAIMSTAFLKQKT